MREDGRLSEMQQIVNNRNFEDVDLRSFWYLTTALANARIRKEHASLPIQISAPDERTVRNEQEMLSLFSCISCI